jgi:hypothetical protein
MVRNIPTKRTSGYILLLLVCFSVSMAGQQKNTAPAADSQAAERADDAHRSLATKDPNSSEEASQFTAAMMALLPKTAGKATTAPLPRRNFIDEYLFSRMEKDGIPHSELTTDAEFCRRVYLDATGLLPTPEALLKFVSDPSPDKRDRLIDSLVGSEEFSEQWGWFLGDIIQGASDFPLREMIKADRPYNEIVHDMITVSGKDANNVTPFFILLGGKLNRNNDNLQMRNKDDMAQTNRLDVIDDWIVDLSRFFLGIDVNCISCHNGAGHLEKVNLYLSRKTRQEFFQTAAFLGKVRVSSPWGEKGGVNQPNDGILDNKGPGYDAANDPEYVTKSMARVLRPARKYEPKFILTGETPRPGMDPREELARMLTENIQFGRTFANHVWGKLMTVPFVEPYDGFDLDRLDPKNPPPAPWTLQTPHGELMNLLAEDFRANHYSIQSLIKRIMKSNAYQLSARYEGNWKSSYAPYYARKFVRVMTGPEVIDSIITVTGRPGNFGGGNQRGGRGAAGGPSITRVKQLSGPPGGPVGALMTAFYQSRRNGNATPPANRASTMQALLMMTSREVNDRVLAGKEGTVGHLVQSNKTNLEIVDWLYLAALGRRPTEAEREIALKRLQQDRQKGAEDLLWALINGTEFVLVS